RPDAPAPAVAQPRALPEPPPPPPQPAEKGSVVGESNGPPIAEEPAPMPIMFTIPAAGATSAPVGVIIPTQAAVAPPASNTQQEQIREQSPGLDVVPAPAIPVMPPAPAAPVMEANRTPTGDRVPAQPGTPLPAPIQSSLPQPAGSQENAVAAPAIVQYPPIQAHDRVQLPTQTLQVREVPAETPAAVDQPQPTVEMPAEPPATRLQAGSHEQGQPHLFIANAVPAGQQGSDVRAANAPATPATRPEQAHHGEPGHGEQQEGHADEENINMMLQGMLQALVEEIVFDAINDERMENTVTEPSPAVSTNVTSVQRGSNASDSSTLRTSTPVTPPPTEIPPPPSQPPPDRRP
ncbi:hypothetical protein OSTOST_22409, partial [Ostertagia ostertagi]